MLRDYGKRYVYMKYGNIVMNNEFQYLGYVKIKEKLEKMMFRIKINVVFI